MKDVPAELAAEFVLPAIGYRTEVRDVLVSTRAASVAELPLGARVGSSSLRRQAQLKVRRRDLSIAPIRGNVNTRLDKLDAGEFDALLLAGAGLQRLGLESRIREYLSLEDSLPAAGQGALGVECPDRSEVIELLASAERSDSGAVCHRRTCGEPQSWRGLFVADRSLCSGRGWRTAAAGADRERIGTSRAALCGLGRRFRCARSPCGGRTASPGRG